MNTTIDVGLGAVFIVFYAAGRFNTPATNRSSTTAGRYFLALFCYCLVGLVFYTTLVQFPHLLAFVMQGNEASVDEWARQLSSPLLVALLLTVLLPKLPFLSEVDNWIRKQLQNMAAIPYEVRRLSAELRQGKLEVSEELQADVRQRLENGGLHAQNINFEPGRTPTQLWTRLAVLLAKLEDWECDRKMSGYLAAFPDEVDRLRKRYEQLVPKAKTCFRLLNETAAGGTTTRTHEAVVRYQEDFVELAAELHAALLDFISRGVLHSELTDGARLKRLQELGFTVEWRRTTFTFNQIMLLFGMVFLVMLAGMVIFSGAMNGMSFGKMLTRLVMVAVIYCVAVACAVFPKEQWKFARHQPGAVRPIAFYVVSGLLAVALSQFINLLFGCFLMRGVEGGLQRFQVTYPWLLSTFATTVTIGVLIDNGRLQHLSRWQQRLMEGLTQGIVTTCVSYLVHLWLLDRVRQVGSLPVNYRVPELDQVMIMAGIVGFILGFCIPTWCRETPRTSPEPTESDCPIYLPKSHAAKPITSG
ncbi:MAG: hypothetical protein ABI651_14615 [Verrucomicrobiota bacterium]